MERKHMAKYLFRVTVESEQPDSGQAATVLRFSVENHDDIIALAQKLGKTSDQDLAFLVGLKLFGQALLADKDNPLFLEFRPHFSSFMKALKAEFQGVEVRRPI